MVLAVDPACRGLGYCLFEGPKDILDWGATDLRIRKNSRSLKKVKDLIETYNPDVIVTEDVTHTNCRREPRVIALIKQIHKLAKTQGIQTKAFSRSQVKEVFSTFGATTKHEIATTISTNYPELEAYQPRKRAVWEAEHPYMHIFVAASLAFTYYFLEDE